MKALIKAIKIELETSYWDYEHCGSGWKPIYERATNFLETVKFSEKLIKKKLEDYEEILNDARIEKIRNEDLPYFFARRIADSVAFSRIPRKFLNAWEVADDVSFVIN